MSASTIGYVQTVREDLLEAAWRSSMAARPRRRGPSPRWVVAAATAMTLIAGGGIGWVVVGDRATPIRRAARSMPAAGKPSEHRPLPSASAVPAPAVGWAAFGANERTLKRVSAGVALDHARAGSVSSIPPTGDLSKVIKTADVSIVVPRGTFGDRFDAANRIADRLGGYVQASSTHGGRSGTLTMRVPARRFQPALSSLRALGRVEAERVSGRDVTAQYVDLTARRRIALERRRVLEGLMRRATSIEQTIRVQNALDDVQLRIEELQGAINVLNDRVSQATIRVWMRETGVEPAVQNVENASIPGAFDRAVAGFFSVLAGVIVGLGYLIPALALLALLWLVVTRVRRRLA